MVGYISLISFALYRVVIHCCISWHLYRQKKKHSNLLITQSNLAIKSVITFKIVNNITWNPIDFGDSAGTERTPISLHSHRIYEYEMVPFERDQTNWRRVHLTLESLGQVRCYPMNLLIINKNEWGLECQSIIQKCITGF